MSKIDEMIKELCPDGVEYKTLGEIAIDMFRGSGIKRTDVTPEGIPCVRYGEIYTTYSISFDECISHTNIDCISNPKFFEHGDLLFAITGESVEDIAKSIVYLGNDRCLAGGDIVVLKHNQNGKYLSYALDTESARRQKSAGRVKSKVVHSNVPSLQAIEIPVPPLEIQEEIVKTLDKFTNYVTELTAELTARKLQYEYYKETILMNGEPRKLSEIASYSKDRIEASELDSSTYVGVESLLQNMTGRVDSERVPNEGNCNKYQKEDILIGNIRPYLKKCWFADNEGGTNGDVLVIRASMNEILPRYLYYTLANDTFFEYDMQYAKGAKMPRGNKEAIMNYVVNVPSIQEQKDAIKILDRFETLCNDIFQGLPAEIEARQKQYEYYRDKLLSFERKEA